MTTTSVFIQPSTAPYPSAGVAGEPRHDAHKSALVRRINQLYHDMTQDVFDADHRYRHRVERQFWHRTIRLVQEAGGGSAGRTVVDLACGTGFITQMLGATLAPEDRLIAVDISSSALRTTASKCRGLSLQLTLGDGAALPLPDESVDLFAINAALHHMPDPQAVCREVHRVLKPSGWFALGYEPNRRHFRSPMYTVSRACDRLAWYASPRQNLRRFRSRLGLAAATPGCCTHDDQVCRTIDDRLRQEGLTQAPLGTETILNHVDPHARGAEDHAGFDAVDLIQQGFAGYEVVRLISSDYLGEAARRFTTTRTFADAVLRAVLPEHGSLLSCLLRKPARAEGRNG